MRFPRRFLLPVLLVFCGQVMAHAQLYVLYANAGLISEYDADSGALIDETLVLGLHHPTGVCYANGMLYVTQQDSGTIDTYDAHTGRPIREQLVSGLTMPQALAVDGETLYVSSLDGNGTSHIGKYNAINGATENPEFVTHLRSPPRLAASDGKLFTANLDGMGGLTEYDAVNGAVLKERFGRVGYQGDGLAIKDGAIWFSSGSQAPTGLVLKLDATTGEWLGAGLLHPLVTGLDYPSSVAVSGDELFVVNGGTVGKYNATTGEVLNPALIPRLGDRMTGIAVIPRVSSGKYAMTNASFQVKSALSNFAFIILMNGNYFFLIVGAVGALLVGGIFALLLRKRASALVIPAATEPPTAAVVGPIPGSADVHPVPTEAAAPASPAAVPAAPPAYSCSALMGIGLTILIVTAIVTSIGGYFVYQLAITNYITAPRQMDTDGLVGIWQFDNEYTRRLDEQPISRQVRVYNKRIEYFAGHGLVTLNGEWRDNEFWAQKDDYSGVVEAAKKIDPEDVEVHENAFDKQSQAIVVCYKVRGDDAEMQALAAKYPPPLVYPPPAGVITIGMTEYELRSLPWKVDSLEGRGQERYDQALVFTYHSDNPHLSPLEVTVKNHRVVLTHGGNA